MRPGDLYVAMPGGRHHGADFAGEAAANGAVAMLSDVVSEQLPTLLVPDVRRAVGPLASWLYGRPSAALDLYGVTGTNGKTSTAYLLDAGLRAAGHTAGLVTGVEVRGPNGSRRATHTTPEAAELQRTLARFRRTRCHSRCNGSLQSRVGSAPHGGDYVSGRHLHQPGPRSPRFSSRHGRLLRGESQPVHRSELSKRGHRNRRRVRTAACERSRDRPRHLLRYRHRRRFLRRPHPRRRGRHRLRSVERSGRGAGATEAARVTSGRQRCCGDRRPRHRRCRPGDRSAGCGEPARGAGQVGTSRRGATVSRGRRLRAQHGRSATALPVPVHDDSGRPSSRTW